MNLTTATPPLTEEQLRVAQLFASMDDRHQQHMIAIATDFARKWPRSTKPALRLVGGGAV